MKLTDEQINALTGRELDAAVARLGGIIVYKNDTNDQFIFTEDREYVENGDYYAIRNDTKVAYRIPEYHKDLNAAMTALDAFLARDNNDYEFASLNFDSVTWRCVLSGGTLGTLVVGDAELTEQREPNAARATAVCWCLLKAVNQ